MLLSPARRLPRRVRRAAALAAFAVSIASFAALVTQIATALPARAADQDLGFEAGIGLPCIAVDSWGAGSVTVTQKRAGATLKQVTLAEGSTMIGCVKPLAAGDVLVIARGATKRTVKVPSATLSVNLAADTVAGTLPASASQVKLTIQDFTAGYSTGLALSPTVSVAGGAFGVDTTGDLDLGRGDRAIVTWVGGADAWRIVRQTATAIVQPGWKLASGTGKPGSSMKVTLKTAKGVVRGVAATTVKTQPSASAGFFEAAFRKSGKNVLPVAGNLVVATGLTGSFKVPAGVPVVSTGANKVDATCPAGSDWLVLRDLTKVAGGRTASGAISVSPVNADGPLALGTRVLVACQAPSGFGVVREVVVE
jgi:hypothetical protein